MQVQAKEKRPQADLENRSQADITTLSSLNLVVRCLRRGREAEAAQSSSGDYPSVRRSVGRTFGKQRSFWRGLYQSVCSLYWNILFAPKDWMHFFVPSTASSLFNTLRV